MEFDLIADPVLYTSEVYAHRFYATPEMTGFHWIRTIAHVKAPERLHRPFRSFEEGRCILRPISYRDRALGFVRQLEVARKGRIVF